MAEKESLNSFLDRLEISAEDKAIAREIFESGMKDRLKNHFKETDGLKNQITELEAQRDALTEQIKGFETTKQELAEVIKQRDELTNQVNEFSGLQKQAKIDAELNKYDLTPERKTMISRLVDPDAETFDADVKGYAAQFGAPLAESPEAQTGNDQGLEARQPISPFDTNALINGN